MPAMKLVGSLLLTVCLLTLPVLSLTLQFDDEKLLEKEYARDVATWLVQMLHKSEPPICTHKRNSEIINSLLGLPKLLNDAGRK